MTKCSRLCFFLWKSFRPLIFFGKYAKHRFHTQNLHFQGKVHFNKLILVIAIFLIFDFDLSGQTVGGASKIYTDFNGFWQSGVGEINTLVKPNNSHNLLGFTWKGVTYSTGVNDGQLISTDVNFSPAMFQAFPVRNIGSTSGTYIGLGQLKDGVDGGISTPPPFPVPPNLANFLTDGLQGLDIGTGVANIKAGELIFDFTGIIDQTQISDGIPDILVSQIADPSSTTDEIYLTDAAGVRVGNSIFINHVNISSVGRWAADFYVLNGTSAAFTNGERDLRLWVGELSAFGIDLANYERVKSMRYKLNGTSDPAFAAFKVGVFDILSANDDIADTDQDEGVEINMLENDQPTASLDPASVRILNEPSNGTVTTDPSTGIVTYTPNPGFSGTDVFTYEVCSNDSDADLCDEATVEVNVRTVILPIALLQFSATLAEDKNVVIKWTTTGEMGNDFFEIQRSLNGIDWEVLEMVKGAGHSNALVHYAFRDKGPKNGYNYYRLKQVDMSGHFEIFDVVSVKVQLGRKDQIRIYPNPTENIFIIEGDPLELDHISLINPYGQIQNQYLEITRISDSKISINMRYIPAGVYVIKMKSIGRIVRKF